MVSRAAIFVCLLAAASPAASQTTPREITEIADLSGLAVSPDGNWIAYRVERPSTVTNRIDVDWYLAPTDGTAPPRALGRLGTAMWNDAGSVLPGDAKWTPDSKAVVIRALVDGRIGLWTSAVDGSGFREGPQSEGDIEAFVVAADGAIVIREGPRRDAIARAEEAERDTGILFDARVDLAQPLYHGASINGRPSTQRFSGDWFDRVPLLADAPRKVIVRSGTGNIGRPASDSERGLLELKAIPEIPESFRSILQLRGVCIATSGCPSDADRIAWRTEMADGRVLAALRAQSGQTTLYVWTPATARFKILAVSAGQLSSGRSDSKPCAIGDKAIFCVEAAASVPPRLVRIEAGGRKQIIDSPNPYPGSDGLLVETIAWQVSGSRASGILIRPKIPGRLPLFITYYRCNGYLRGGTGDEWPLRALAANGIASLCIDVLPGGDIAQERYQIGLEAVRAAIDELDRRGVADRRYVGMGGLSFGSEVATWTAMHSELLTAVSIASVQIEPYYYWYNARPGRETFARNIRQNWKLGPPDTEPAEWQALSAALNIEKIAAPMLLQLPESEARQSAELMSKLATKGLGETHLFPLAPHLKVEPRQKLAAYERNLDWFRFWLKGEIDPDPAKADQYRRWRLLGSTNGAASIDRSQRSTSAISSSRK